MSNEVTPMTDAMEKRYCGNPAYHVQPIFDHARRLERIAAQLAEALEQADYQLHVMLTAHPDTCLDCGKKKAPDCHMMALAVGLCAKHWKNGHPNNAKECAARTMARIASSPHYTPSVLTEYNKMKEEI